MITHDLMITAISLKNNFNQKYRRISDGLILSADEEGNLIWESGHKKLNIIEDRFEKVQEPVSFLEAVQHFKEGKTIICKLNGYDRIYNRIGGFLDQDGNLLTSSEILNGKWFIKEAEHE